VDQLRIWASRDHRVLYEVDERTGRLIIVAVRKKDESTYNQGSSCTVEVHGAKAAERSGRSVSCDR
jgi:hypothetical protein